MSPEQIAATFTPRERMLIARRAEREHAPHYIYELRGPSGVYVGCTLRPAVRLSYHRSVARTNSRFLSHDLHRAMRRDGIDAYRFTIVAQAIGLASGNATEDAIISQHVSAGERVLNGKMPQDLRAGLHG